MEEYTTNSLEETYALGSNLAQRLETGDCVALVGQLGAGKTAFVRGVAMGLGIADERLVSSPTYVLVQEYPARVPMYHVDLYRLSDPQAETANLAINEMLAEGIVLIEWADRAEDELPRPLWRIEISIIGEMSRLYEVTRIE